MKQKGNDNTITAILVVIVLVALSIILSNFGQGIMQGASLEAASASTHLVDPSANEPLQLDGVDLSSGAAYVRYFNCETNGSIDSVVINQTRYTCNPPITLICGTNEVLFDNCSIDQNVTYNDIIKICGPNGCTPDASAGSSGGDSTVVYNGSANPDSNPPTIDSATLNPPYPETDETILLSVQATDAENTVTNCQYELDDSATWVDINDGGSYGTATVNVSETIPAQTQGSHTLDVKCTDGTNTSGQDRTNFKSRAWVNSDTLAASTDPVSDVQVAYNSDGTATATYQRTKAGTGTIYAAYNDGISGGPWLSNTAVFDDYGVTFIPAEDPAIDYGTDGNAVVLWTSNSGGGGGGTVHYSEGEQASWSPDSTVGTAPGDDSEADFAIATDGNGIVVWADTTIALDPYWSEWDGSTWTPASALDTTAEADRDPAIAFDPANANNAFVVWTAGTKVYAKQWNGTSWNTTITIDTATNNVHNASIAFHPSNSSALAVWYEEGSTNGSIKYSYWNGSTWSASATITTTDINATTASDTSIAFSSDGFAVAMWTNDANAVGYSRKATASAAWTTPSNAVTAVGRPTSIDSDAEDSLGYITLVYTEAVNSEVRWARYAENTLFAGG